MAFLVEGDIAHAKRLGLGDVGRAGIAAVARDLAWRLAVRRNVALQHGQKALGIGRIAGLDDDVEDQATATGRQIDFVTVLHLAAAFDDDVGVRLEQTDHFSLAGTASPSNTRRLVWVMTRSIKGR